MRIDSYILAAKDILAQYDGKLPFASWIKSYFSANKKFGSRDRKTVAHLCYSYFRLGRSFANYATEDKIKLALFLTYGQANASLEEINTDWNNKTDLTLKEKFSYLNAEKEFDHVFPFVRNVSELVDRDAFIAGHFVQPLLFIRMRPGKEEKVMNKLADASIHFARLLPATLALENATHVENALELDKEAVVQDLSSQQALGLLQEWTTGIRRISAWDCCAASGGKSILLCDTVQKIDLTVSDIRSSILKNLHNRFKRAGIKNYRSFVCDVSAPQFVPAKKYDLVICDAPCSGSGTWSRTPEQLSFFTEERLNYYSNLQKWIVLNASEAVDKEGALLYITCSVYKAENEDIVAYIETETKLKLQRMEYYKGYDKGADTLFAALFVL